MAKFDAYQAITDSIVESLERGVLPWVKPWKARAGGGYDASALSGMPSNRQSGKAYNGINVVLLWGAAMARGYDNDQWLTFKQARALGGCVRKGETSTRILFFRMLESKTQVDSTGQPKKIPCPRVYSVFNIDQCDGVGGVEPVKLLVDESYQRATNVLKGFQTDGLTVRHANDRACYSPVSDAVAIPNPYQFEGGAGSWWATMLHELTHATGNKSRLARQYGRRFGDNAYAFEELVAELGSAFLCSACRVPGEQQHTEYLANWLKVLKSDKRAIITAAAAARRASEWALEHADNSMEAVAEVVGLVEVKPVRVPVELDLFGGAL